MKKYCLMRDGSIVDSVEVYNNESPSYETLVVVESDSLSDLIHYRRQMMPYAVIYHQWEVYSERRVRVHKILFMGDVHECAEARDNYMKHDYYQPKFGDRLTIRNLSQCVEREIRL